MAPAFQLKWEWLILKDAFKVARFFFYLDSGWEVSLCGRSTVLYAFFKTSAHLPHSSSFPYLFLFSNVAVFLQMASDFYKKFYNLKRTLAKVVNKNSVNNSNPTVDLSDHLIIRFHQEKFKWSKKKKLSFDEVSVMCSIIPFPSK